MNIRRVEGRFAPTEDGKAAEGARGIVSSAFPDATAAGVEVLAQGGNAIDAACAVGFALGVCEPQASGLGGQSLGMVHVNGRTFAIDGSSRVPSLAHQDRMNEDDRRLGYRATTVPSTVATYGWLHEHYGRLAWSDVLAPAIRIARDGYLMSTLQADLQAREAETMRSMPNPSAARYFLKDGENPHEAGDRFRQPDLAATLELIASQGAIAFYQGDIADQIDADMRANDGFLRKDDLVYVPWPLERPALRRRYRNLLVASMPPPGAGRTLLLVMMMLNHVESRFLRGGTPDSYHFIAETFRKAFLQRKDRPFEPNSYPQIPDKRMLSRDFARSLAESIAGETDLTLPFEDVPGENMTDTTHFCVMDEEGNTVSMTQSIELVYGAKVAADGLGFLYNNYSLALETDNPAHPYYLRPNAVPWSSASPVIVFRGREPWLAAGSPGSERIFSAVAQFLVNTIDASMPLAQAINAPRFHTSTGGVLSLEAERFDPAVVQHLDNLGYKMDEREPYAFYLGCVQATLKRQTGPGFQGAADIRRDGTAAGFD